MPLYTDCEPNCRVVIRSRLACTPWEKLCKAVVGDPVHMDVVLAKPQSSSARFCFSAYMNQDFEMCLMDKSQVMDRGYINHSIDITEAEYDRCMKHMIKLAESKVKYDYADALLLMPMAPKGSKTAPIFASMMSPLIQDVESTPKKVFCSQSVVLMLRECLDDCGIHAGIVEKVRQLNSRLVSPKMVFDIMQNHPFAEVITNTQLMKLGIELEEAQGAAK
jgi:hypothetical protein